MKENKTIKAKSFDEFKRLIVEMAESEDGAGISAPLPFGWLNIHKEKGKWIIDDCFRAPDSIVGRFDSFEELLANFKRDEKTLRDVWREAEFIILDEA